MTVTADEIRQAIKDSLDQTKDIALERAAEAILALIEEQDEGTVAADELRDLTYEISDVATWCDEAEGAIDSIRNAVGNVEVEIERWANG